MENLKKGDRVIVLSGIFKDREATIIEVCNEDEEEGGQFKKHYHINLFDQKGRGELYNSKDLKKI